MSVLTFISYNQLQSFGFPPEIIVKNYEYYETFYWRGLIIFSVILLILSNILLWTRKIVWALWLTFLFSVVFIMVETWWLSEILYHYKKGNGLGEGGFSIAGIAGAFLCIGLAVGVFANQFLILRLKDKMDGKPEPKEITDLRMSEDSKNEKDIVESEINRE